MIEKYKLEIEEMKKEARKNLIKTSVDLNSVHASLNLK